MSSIPERIPTRPPLPAPKTSIGQTYPPAMMQLHNTYTLHLGHHRDRGRWRRHMKKPARRFRRAVRRLFFRKGKGRGMGGRRARRLHSKGIATFLARLTDCDVEDLFSGGIGRGKGLGTQRVKAREAGLIQWARAEK
eukprot:7285736-Pyramimonas_sp.AAC.1